MMANRFILRNADIKRNAMTAIMDAPANAVVTIAQPSRTVQQNAKLWAMLADVARCEPEGRKWVPETWKAAFMHYLGHQVAFCEGLDGCGPFPMGFRSSHLTVPQMADLITCISEYGDRHGVVWSETLKGGFMDERDAA